MDKKRTLLIVDDVSVNREILSALFETEYDILQAEDGVEALEALNKEFDRISIMILDLTMPRMDGFEVLTIMKKESLLTEIPVVIVSGAEVDAEIRALEIGASDFISKPFDARVVIPRINNLVAKREYDSLRLENIQLQEEAKLQKKIQVMLDTVPGGIAVFENDEKNSIKMIRANEGLFEMFGYLTDEQKDVFFNDFVSIIHFEDKNKLSHFSRNITNMQPFAVNVRIRKSDGEWLWTMITAKPELSQLGVMQFYCVLVDISTEQAIKAELRYRAEYDQLTGIYNKDAFYRLTKEMFEDNPDVHYVLLRWNVERFKLINDLFGKSAGDTVLKKMADSLQNETVGLGTYGRLEGDHFVTCIPLDKFDPETLHKKIGDRFSSNDTKYPISIGLGVYTVEDAAMPVELMCDRANIALQTIKGNYLVRYAYYDEKLRDAMLAEEEIRSEMKKALLGREFQICLQPVYSVSTGKPVSAEVLIRWIHPVKGVISPGKFIPVFEQNGFIAELDHYVWEEACKHLRKRKDAGLPDFPVSVNVSRMSLYNGLLFEEIITLTRKYGIPPSLFRLEITESAYNDNPDQLLATIGSLQQAGFPILMDDFGSGYSSLNTLKDIPVDILKIDMKFLEDFETSQKAGNILTSILRMAQWLDLAVIAEGVETETQVDFLSSIGCDRIQGYYFARPMPANDFEAHVASAHYAGLSKSDKVSDMEKGEINMLLGSKIVDRLLTGISGGIAFYEIFNDNIEVTRVNKEFYEIMGFSPSSFTKITNNIHDMILEDDRDLLKQACFDVAAQSDPREMLLKIQYPDASKAEIEAVIRYLGSVMDRKILCLTLHRKTL
ncbi:MAG: EAL domain-containing protein [Leptospirales bacterium]|nr:EAL domain-containing protein [Leptospirales bacterium]